MGSVSLELHMGRSAEMQFVDRCKTLTTEELEIILSDVFKLVNPREADT